MHDPKTVAFDIKSPFRSKPSEHWPEGYRSTWVTIWHRDPETDGSDDSCGWSYPRLTERQRERLKGLAWSEAYEPWFQALRAKRIEDHVSAEHLMRGAVQLVCRALDIRASWGEICTWACRFIHSPMDNFRSGLCHLPGYHTNFADDRKDQRESCAYGLFSGIARHVLADRRPWWRHPKWHVWHWRLQVHPLQQFKRRAFSRCEGCGGRFAYGESPVTNSWDSDGPRWFRGERGVYHSACMGAVVAGERAAAN